MIRLRLIDKLYLKKLGEDKEDIMYIEKYINTISATCNDKPITLKKARRLLGYKWFISGIDRAMFHMDSVRDTKNGKAIYFERDRNNNE